MKYSLVSWVLAICGVMMVRSFLEPCEWDPLMIGLLLLNCGPYLLLGLGCHLVRKKLLAWSIGTLLQLILLIASGGVYYFYMFLTKGSQGGFVFLWLPMFTWPAAIISMLALFCFGNVATHKDDASI